MIQLKFVPPAKTLLNGGVFFFVHTTIPFSSTSVSKGISVKEQNLVNPINSFKYISSSLFDTLPLWSMPIAIFAVCATAIPGCRNKPRRRESRRSRSRNCSTGWAGNASPEPRLSVLALPGRLRPAEFPRYPPATSATYSSRAARPAVRLPDAAEPIEFLLRKAGAGGKTGGRGYSEPAVGRSALGSSVAVQDGTCTTGPGETGDSGTPARRESEFSDAGAFCGSSRSSRSANSRSCSCFNWTARSRNDGPRLAG